MRNTFILVITLFIGTWLSAQVKIGDNPQNIDPSSVLELESTDKVLVITRVTTIQMNAIVPSQGALCYNTDLQAVHFYDGTQWVNIGSSSTSTGGPLTADPIVNDVSTIVISPTATGDNLEVAPNSISSLQIIDGGINGIDIQDGSIGPGKLQNNSVTEEKLSENSVGAFALDNDNIGVSAFNNDVGYLTAGDLGASVSTDALNAITSGADGGAFYDDSNLMMDVLDNSMAIAMDDDQNPTNELQNLIYNATTNILTLSTPATTGNEIDLSGLAGGTADGSETKVTAGTNVTITGDGTTATPYIINSTGGGTGSTEVVDGASLTGVGTGADPFKIEPGLAGQFLTTDAAGAMVNWTTVTPGGGGTTEEADQTSITGLGTNADPFKVAPGTADQVLRTATDGLSVLWGDLPTGGAVIADATLIGDGSSAATALGIAPGTADQVLRTAADGLSVLWGDLPTGGAVITDITLTGDGSTVGTALSIADNAVSTNKILDANVTDAKIAPGAADQILRTATDGFSVGWVDLPTGAAILTDATLTGDGSSATTELGLADEAVTLEKINPNGATNGQVMQWNDDAISPGVGGWETADQSPHVGTPMALFYADATTGLATTPFNPNNGDITTAPSLVWDPTKRINSGALGIGLDGGPQSDVAKVHIMEGSPDPIDFPLQIQKRNGTNGGVAVGVLFAVEAAGNFGKGSVAFERTSAWGIGDFHFLQNKFEDPSIPTLADKSFTITSDKNIVLYGGIDVDVTDAVTDLGTAGEVLTSTGTGVEWAAAVGLLDATIDGQVLTWDADAISATEGAWVAGVSNLQSVALDIADDEIDILESDGATVSSSIKLDRTTLEAEFDGTNNVIRIKPGAIDLATPVEQILSTTTAGVVGWRDIPAGGNIPTGTAGAIFFSDGAADLVEDPTQINYDDANNRLNLGAPFANNQQKLNVNGNARASAFLGAVATTPTSNPVFRFVNDADTGMKSTGADELVLVAAGQDMISLDSSIGNGNVAIINASVELEEELIDINGNVGSSGQVLTSTGAGVSWSEPVIFSMGKINPAGTDNINGATLTGIAGNYTITFTNGRPDADYIIQLTVTGNNRIFVTNQTAADFQISILDDLGNPVTTPLPIWYFTVSDF